MKIGFRFPLSTVISVLLAFFTLVSGCFNSVVWTYHNLVDLTDLTKITDAPSVSDAGDVRLIAHRGLSAIAPENTVPAIEAAGEYGFFGAEFDIYASADGEWVLMHNRDVEEMTDAQGDITSFTLEQLRTFNIDGGSNCKRFKELKIPTLDEALAACAAGGLAPVIEIKDGRLLWLDKIADLLEKHSLEQEAVIISFNAGVLSAVKAAHPSLECWLLTGAFDASVVASCVAAGIDGIDFNGELQLAEGTAAIEAARDEGLELCAWTIDGIETADALYRAGVTCLTTNSIIPR